MSNIPRLIRKTRSVKQIISYMDTVFDKVLHTTLNPNGPGAIRIHLIPPKKQENELNPSVAIINGSDIVPVNYAWAVILAEMIRETNRYDGKEIGEEQIQSILNKTAENVKKIMPVFTKRQIKNDIQTIYRTLKQIAYREEVTTNVQYMSMGEYAQYMTAPHRMDLMVSAMTKNGKWHCNQKCIHCYAAGQKLSEEEELSAEDWKKILKKCRTAGIVQVTFTGGEPTMRDDLIELIREARWFVSRLNTNGIRLTREYCHELRKAELDSVQITFYSQDPEIHNRLVGASQYQNTVNAIENAISEGLSVSVNTPLCTLNADYVKTLQFLHEKGVIYVTCSGLITTGNAVLDESEKLQLTSSQLEKILRDGQKVLPRGNTKIKTIFVHHVRSETSTCRLRRPRTKLVRFQYPFPSLRWLRSLPSKISYRWSGIRYGSVNSQFSITNSLYIACFHMRFQKWLSPRVNHT